MKNKCVENLGNSNDNNTLKPWKIPNFQLESSQKYKVKQLKKNYFKNLNRERVEEIGVA